MAAESETEKNKLGIVLAIVAGLLAMGMVFVFLQKTRQDAAATHSAAAKSSLAKKSILIAVRDLPSGHVLSVNDDLKQTEIPLMKDTETFARQCVSADRANELEGRRLGVGISAQYPLLFSNLVDSTRIDDDFTDGYLKTINVEKVNLIGNQLIPGDRVVVLATLPKKPDKEEPAAAAPLPMGSNGQLDPSALTAAILQSMPSMGPMSDQVETVTVLDNAEVFLVGSMRKVDRVQMGYFPSETSEASEITFHLSLTEALKLTQYEKTPGAQLTLLLCPRKKGAE